MTTTLEEPMVQTFEALNLSEKIMLALKEMAFTTPSEIQAQSIPHVMNGIDIIAQAPTGSGKTCAYGIPLLEKLDMSLNTVQALILCPTRELVIQVHKVFDKLTQFMDNVNVVSVYGGQRIEKQLDALRRNPQIVVATPGRLMDHLRRGSVSLDNIKIAVLDEADEMLDMGFRDDIHTILEGTSTERQTILFSATMAKDIIAITKKFQKHPLIIDVTNNLLNAPDIEQSYFEVVEKDKPELITRLLELHNLQLALVFCNTKSNVDRLVEILKTRGYFADALHGDMNQAQREKVMRGFKNGSVKLLVATDVAGRGIDVKDVEGVFNYDLPRDDEDYIHRIGRTGRAGKSGVAFSFVSKKQISALRRIEKANGLQILKKERPTAEEVDAIRVDNYFKSVKEVIKNSDLTPYIEKLSALIDKETSMIDIAAALYKISVQAQVKKINKNIVFEEETYDEGQGRSGRGRRSPFGGRSSSGGGRRFGRGDRNDRPRFDRSERGERSERNDRNGGERFAKPEGSDRPIRAERTDKYGKSERFDKSETISRGERPDYPKRERFAKSKSEFKSDFKSEFKAGKKQMIDDMVNAVKSFEKKSTKKPRRSFT